MSPGAAGTGPKSTPRKNPRDFLLARGGGSADPDVTLSPETLTVDQLQAPGLQNMENQLRKQEKNFKKRVVTAAEGEKKKKKELKIHLFFIKSTDRKRKAPEKWPRTDVRWKNPADYSRSGRKKERKSKCFSHNSPLLDRNRQRKRKRKKKKTQKDERKKPPQARRDGGKKRSSEEGKMSWRT